MAIQKSSTKTALDLGNFESVVDEKLNSIFQRLTKNQTIIDMMNLLNENPSEYEIKFNKKINSKSIETFDVLLLSSGEGIQKIQVLKTVREITGLGLKEAKDIVDGNSQKQVKSGVSKKQVQEIKKRLEEVGATVEIK